MMLTPDMLEREADRINEQNMALMNALVEYFGEEVPVFMDAVSEDELPENNMTYVFIESGNYNVSDDKNRMMRDNVTVTYFSEGRENPTQDRLAIVYAIRSVKLRFESSNQQTVFFDDTNRLVGIFEANASRPILKGCL